jgi:hypothetical protein
MSSGVAAQVIKEQEHSKFCFLGFSQESTEDSAGRRSLLQHTDIPRKTVWKPVY